MITLHESNITSFPLDNGIGVLKDVIRAYAEEELNGLFEFYMEYDSEGHLVDELKEERIIKAKAQDKLGYQLFRIYSITKNHENDNLIVRAQHITYDLADNFVESLVANNLTKKQVMELIGASTVIPHPFNLTSSNTTTISSTSLYRTNPLQMIAGMDGSVLQIWGGQIERDNFNLILHDRRGSDDGVKVTYEKNITGLEATFDISGLVTRIFPFVYIEETDNEPSRLITVNGKYIDSPHINDYEKIYIKPIDYSNDERIDIQDKTDAQIRQQLTEIASKYFEETDNDKIKVDMEVQFEHLWETEEYKDLAVLELVGMGDTVTIEHSRLKVDATAIVNYIRYDCIAEKNEEVRLGSVKARLTDNVNKTLDVVEKVEQAQQTANQAIRAANGKNTIYYGPDEPEGGIEGDLWFRVVDGEYTRTYRHDGIQWQLVLSVDVRDAIDEAQQAKDEAQQAVDRANQATQQATNAINQAQTAFDEAQTALTTVTGLQGDVTNLSTLVDEHTGQISSITQSVGNLTTRIGDAEGNITTLQQTSASLAARLTDAEGNITTLTATVNGLQTTVSDVQGDVSSVTQLANALQVRMTDAEGNISTLTQTASSLQSTISSLRFDFDNLEIGGRNLLLDSTFNKGEWVSNHYTSILPPEPDKPNSSIMRLYHVNDTGNTNINSPIWNNNRIYLEPREGDKITFSFDFYCEDSSVSPARNIATFRRYSDRTGGSVVQSIFNETMDTFGIGGVYGRWVRAKYTYTFTSNTAVAGWYAFGVYMSNSVSSGSSGTRVADYKYREIKIEHGDKSTDWSPAPEDMATQSQITQLSDAINLRVMKGDVINQINLDTSGVLISGKKLILDGDTTVTGTFRVGNANITSVDASKVTVGELVGHSLVGGSVIGGYIEQQSGSRRLEMYNGIIDSFYNGQLAMRFGQYKMEFYNEDEEDLGAIYPVQSLVTGQKGLALEVVSDSRFLVGPKISGVVYPSIEINPTERRMYVAGPYSGARTGAKLELYANRRHLSHDVDFTSYDQPAIILDQSDTTNNMLQYFGGTNRRSGAVWQVRWRSSVDSSALRLEANSDGVVVQGSLTNANGNRYYLNNSGGGDLTTEYTLRAGGIRTLSGNNNFYVGVPSGGELRVTSTTGTAGSDITYRDARARNWHTSSSIEYKTNIKHLGICGLEIINDLEVVEYDLIDNLQNGIDDRQVGFISEHSEVIATRDKKAINLYALSAYNTKAIQELDTKLTDNVEFLKLKIQYLEQKIKILEEKVS